LACHPWFLYKSPFQAVALVASSGGLRAFAEVLSGLPSHFAVPVFVLLHRRSRLRGEDALVSFLKYRSRLPVMQARNGLRFSGGTIYVAPPDQHLLLDSQGGFIVSPPIDRRELRPSADLLLESLAERCGANCIAVVLSGSLNDCADGVRRVKESGGLVLVQDPKTAFSSGMPNAAISTGCTDFVLSPKGIANALVTLTMVPSATGLFSASACTRIRLSQWKKVNLL
jgi:two-component system chemotaxis response regulator CheB